MKKILINISEQQYNDLTYLAEWKHTTKSALIRYAISRIVRRIKFEDQSYNPLAHMTEDQYNELINIAKTKWIDED